jgi:NADH-quinone oxidoreductase subunit N
MDFIILRPEFFLLFGFLILLRYGTGGLVTPYVEIVTIPSLEGNNGTNNANRNKKRRNDAIVQYSKNPTTGPNHAASALCYWAVVWC